MFGVELCAQGGVGFVKVGVLGVRPAIDLMFVDIALWMLCCCFVVVLCVLCVCVGGCVTLLSA